VRVAARAEVEDSPAWRASFDGHRQGHRYYRIVEDTIRQNFDYRYFVIEDDAGAARAVQPFFLVDQDILDGAGKTVRKLAGGVLGAARRAGVGAAVGGDRVRAVGHLAGGAQRRRGGGEAVTGLLIFLCVLCQVFLVAGQVLLKRAMTGPGDQPWRRAAVRLFPGVACMTAWFFLWLGLLAQLDLSKIFPFEGLNPALMILAAAVFLNERIAATTWAGIARRASRRSPRGSCW
jgi:uncharacterized membrane protein